MHQYNYFNKMHVVLIFATNNNKYFSVKKKYNYKYIEDSSLTE